MKTLFFALSLVGCTVLGATSALVFNQFVSGGHQRPLESQAPDSGFVPSAPDVSRYAEADIRPTVRTEAVAELANRLSALESSSRGDAGHSQTSLPSLEERRQIVLAEHDRRVARFDSEGVDTRWARGARDAVMAGLEPVVNEGKARVIGVECKTTMCAATLEWPNLSIAQEEYAKVVQAPYRIGCNKEITLANQAKEDGPVRVVATFDCEQSRTE